MNTIAFDIELQEQRAPELYLVPRAWLDGELMTDFTLFAIDLDALVASKSESGELFVFTCWCSVPGCAGIGRGIRVTQAANVVTWHAGSPAIAGVFRFDRALYVAAIDGLIRSIPAKNAELRARGVRADLVPYGSDHYLGDGA